MDPLHRQLLECFTAETTTTNALDDSITTASLSSILASISSSTSSLEDLETDSLALPATERLHSQLAAIAPATYQRMVDVLAQIGESSEAVQAATWPALTAEDIACRPLLAAAGVQLQRLSSRSLLLASCYAMLLALPSPPVFLASQRILRRILILLQSWAQKKQQLIIQHKTNKRTKHGKGKRAEVEEMEVDDEEDVDEVAGEEPSVQEEVEQLLSEAGERCVMQLLRAMQRLLSQWSLVPMADLKPTVIDALVAVTRTQAEDSDGSPAMLAWQLLRSLCQPLHGDVAATFSLLLKPLLPNCLMSLVLHTTPSPPRPLQIIHTATIHFLASTTPTPAHLLPFLQHLLVSMPDKADYRRLIQSSLVHTLVQQHHTPLLAAFAPFLFRVSRNAKPVLRQAAVEVAVLLLTSESGLGVVEEVGMVGGMLELLLLRCSDRSPVVRTRALGALCELLQLAGEREEVRDALTAVLEEGEEVDEEDEERNRPARRTSLFLTTPHRNTQVSLSAMDLYTPVTTASMLQPNTPSAAPPSLGIQSLLRLLHRRSTDPKALVRRSALLALHQLLLLHSTAPQLLPSLSAVDLQVLYDGCMDASVAVRKTSCGVLTGLVRVYAADEVMAAVWCGAVLPLVEDAEASVAERAVQCVNEAVLERLEGGDDVARAAVLKMLGAMDEPTVRHLQLAIARLLRQNSISRALLAQLNASIGSSQERGVWMLVEAICQHQPDVIDMQRLCATWNELGESKELSDDLLVRVLACVAHTASRLPMRKMVEMATQLNTRVCDFHSLLSPQLVKAHIHTLATLTTAVHKHSGTSQRVDVPQWDNELLVASSLRLEQLVLSGQVTGSSENEAVVVRCLFGVGELVVRGTVKPTANTVSCVQSLTAATLSASTQPSVALSNTVRAHAFLCLGKLCLKDQPLAKRSLPLFVATLTASHSTPVAIRNNLLLVLADLCRTFTALVDPHLPALVGCLSDGCALLRRHALLVVCQLVQEDYVKLRTSVLMALLAALADEDDAVVAVARSSLTHLMQQHSNKLQHSFLDAIFFLNGCVNVTAPASAVSAAATVFSLSSYSRRSVVYDFLCCQLSDESKLLTASKLCQDVLAAVVDGTLPLTERTSAVVHDTLTILASDNMKLHSGATNKSNTNDDEPDDDTDSQPAQHQPSTQHVADSLKQAKSRLLSKLSKRSILEQVLPVLIELKRKLEVARSPLVRGVLEWLRCLYVEWRSDVVAVLAADRQLAVEMEYDMRRMEEERTEKSKRHSEQRRLDSATSRGRPKSRARVEAPSSSRVSLSNVAASLPAPSPVRPARPSLPSESPVSAKPSERASVPKSRSSLPGNAAMVSSSVPFATPARAAGRSKVQPSPSSAVFQSPRLLRGHSTPASTRSALSTTKRLSLRAMAAPVPLFASNAQMSRTSVSPVADKENTAAALTVNFSAAVRDSDSATTWKLDKLTLSSAKKIRQPYPQPTDEEAAEDDEQPGSRPQHSSGMSLRKRRISASADSEVQQEIVEESSNELPVAAPQTGKRTRSERRRNSTGL